MSWAHPNYWISSGCVCRRKIVAAELMRIAKPNQISQLDSGPFWKTNVSVHPRLFAKLQKAKTYAENTAGPISADNNAPNCWAVSVAQIPTFRVPVLIVCSSPTVQILAGSTRTVIAVAVFLPSAIHNPAAFLMHVKCRRLRSSGLLFRSYLYRTQPDPCGAGLCKKCGHHREIARHQLVTKGRCKVLKNE